MVSKKHFGVYGIIIENGRILLISKIRGPYTGLYDLVGGSPEQHEIAEQTLAREVLEETGIRVVNATYITDYVYRCSYHEQGKHIELEHVAKIYRVDVFDAIAFDDSICAEDVHGAVWLKIANIEKVLLSPIAQFAISLIKKANAQNCYDS